MLDCFLGRFGDNRNVQALADDFSDISKCDALFGNCVIPSPRSGLLECKPKKMGGIESVHGAPAITPVAHIRRNALFTRNADETWNEAMIAVAVDGW